MDNTLPQREACDEGNGKFLNTQDVDGGTHLHKVFLALGTNLGDRKANIAEAVRLIGIRIGHVERLSSLYETEPWGFNSDNMFANAALMCLTTLSPMEVLHATQRIERDMGRTEKSVNGSYHDRIIDVDILLYDNLEMHTPELTIPHPQMEKRDFVMKPLNEITL